MSKDKRIRTVVWTILALLPIANCAYATYDMYSAGHIDIISATLYGILITVLCLVVLGLIIWFVVGVLGFIGINLVVLLTPVVWLATTIVNATSSAVDRLTEPKQK